MDGDYQSPYTLLCDINSIICGWISGAQPSARTCRNQWSLSLNTPAKSSSQRRYGVLWACVHTCANHWLRQSMKVGYLIISRSLTRLLTRLSRQVPFSVNPASLENSRGRSVPNFLVEGKLYTAACPITKPLTGEVSEVVLYCLWISR